MSEDFTIDSIDKGLRLPILYNLVSSGLTFLITILYITVVARILSPEAFYIYSSIYTLYTLATLLSTRVVQWAARDYVRIGEKVYNGFSTLFLLSTLLSSTLSPMLIIYLLHPNVIDVFHILVVYAASAVFFHYVINLIGLIGPRYYNLLYLISISIRLVWVLASLYLFNIKGYIVPLTGELWGYLVSASMGIVLSKGRIRYRLFIPKGLDLKYVNRILRLSIVNYFNMLRSNLPNIHYFIAYFAGLATILINSLWIVYRILSWGTTFFRGFFTVIYSRQFYNRLGGHDFSEYLNIISYMLVPTIVYSLYLHRSLVSIFNPKYVEYSILLPIALSLILLEVIRITLLKLSFGVENIDKSLDTPELKEVFSSHFTEVSMIQIRNLLLISTILTIAIYLLEVTGYTVYIPYLFLILYIVEVIWDDLDMYVKVRKYTRLGIDILNILFFVLASIPGYIYLYYFGVGELIVVDIFPDSIPIIIHMSVAYVIYVLTSLIIPWVRRDLKALINFVFKLS